MANGRLRPMSGGSAGTAGGRAANVRSPRWIGVVVRRTRRGDEAVSEVETWSAYVTFEVEAVGKHAAMLRALVTWSETAGRTLLECPLSARSGHLDART